MSIQRKGSRYCVWTLKWGPTGCLISGHETIFPGTPFLLWNLRKFAQHTFLSTLGPPPVSWFQAWSLGTLRWPYMMETQTQEALRAQHLLIIRCHLKRHHHHVSSFSTCVFNLSLLCGWVSIFIVFNSTGDLGHLFFFFFLSPSLEAQLHGSMDGCSHVFLGPCFGPNTEQGAGETMMKPNQSRSLC